MSNRLQTMEPPGTPSVNTNTQFPSPPHPIFPPQTSFQFQNFHVLSNTPQRPMGGLSSINASLLEDFGYQIGQNQQYAVRMNTDALVATSYVYDLDLPLPHIIPAESCPTWAQHVASMTPAYREKAKKRTSLTRFSNLGQFEPKYEVDEDINGRIALVRGDITAIQADLIACCTDEALDDTALPTRAILTRGGAGLRGEFNRLTLRTGEARTTPAYNLPAKTVVHVAAPTVEKPAMLRSCYEACFRVVLEGGHKTFSLPIMTSVAYPIAPAHQHYPLIPSIHVALRTLRRWLEDHWSRVTLVLLVASTPREFSVYEELLLDYFPCPPPPPPPPTPEPEPLVEEPKPKKKKKKGTKKGARKKGARKR